MIMPTRVKTPNRPKRKAKTKKTALDRWTKTKQSKTRSAGKARKQETVFRALAENLPTLCWIANADGYILWYNSRWYEYTGTTFKDMHGWGWQSVHHPRFLSPVLERWKHSIATGESFEMVFPLRRADGAFRPFLTRVAPYRDKKGKVVRWFGMNTDITAQRRYEEHLRLLINELNHRVKNTLGVIQSVAVLTFKDADDIQTARRNFDARLLALSAAHNLLTSEIWRGANIRQIAMEALSPFGSKTADGPFCLTGPDIWLRPRVVVSLSMAMHELATNAVKYGALSNGSGRVNLSWSKESGPDGEVLHIDWLEQDGPPVKPPTLSGFGTRLIREGVKSDLGGSVGLAFPTTGLACRMEIPIQNLPNTLNALEYEAEIRASDILGQDI